MSTSPTIPAPWRGLIDDAAIFPPGNAPVLDALAAYAGHRDSWYAGLVGPFVLRDTDLPLARTLPARLAVVVTGGAGQLAGPLGLCRRLGLDAATLEVALRDLDDLSGNARRVVAAVDAARADGLLDDETAVHVELPQTATDASWLRAADVVAESELRLKFRTGGVEAYLHPDAALLAGWIDAALDRETPFKCTAGLHRAVRHTTTDGFDRPVDRHGFLNVLLATRIAFDGAGTAAVATLLEQRDPDPLLTLFRELGDDAMTGARHWFTSYGSCSVTEPLDDLTALGLVEAP